MNYKEFVEQCITTSAEWTAVGGGVSLSIAAAIPSAAVGGAIGIALSPISIIRGAFDGYDYCVSEGIDSHHFLNTSNPLQKYAVRTSFTVIGAAVNGIFNTLAATAISGKAGYDVGKYSGNVLGQALGTIAGGTFAVLATPIFFIGNINSANAEKDMRDSELSFSTSSLDSSWELVQLGSSKKSIEDDWVFCEIWQGNVGAELEEFLSQRTKYPNRARLNRAFVGKDVIENIPHFLNLTKEFSGWLKNKLGHPIFEEFKTLVFSSLPGGDINATADTPNFPVKIGEKLFCHMDLVKWSITQKLSPDKIMVPDSNDIVSLEEVKPHWLSQSMIERLVVWIYQFHAIQQDNKTALSSFTRWRESECSNEERLARALPANMEFNDFVTKVLSENSDTLPNPKVSLYSHTHKIPNIPVLFEDELYDLMELTEAQKERAIVAYDVQINIEYLIYRTQAQQPLPQMKHAFPDEPQRQTEDSVENITVLPPDLQISIATPLTAPQAPSPRSTAPSSGTSSSFIDSAVELIEAHPYLTAAAVASASAALVWVLAPSAPSPSNGGASGNTPK